MFFIAHPSLDPFWNEVKSIDLTSPLPLFIAAVAVGIPIFLFRSPKSDFACVNSPAWWEFYAPKQLDWLRNGLEILSNSRKTLKGKPFRVITEFGEMTVLPPESAERLKSEPSMNFRMTVFQDFHASLPPFEPFGLLMHKSEVLQKVIRKQLTKQLNFVTAPLSSECTHAIELHFGMPADWAEVNIKDHILDVVARVSSRVFLGEELCRNEDWLRITKSYAITSFKAAAKLRLIPNLLRPIASFIEPDCRRSGQALADARRLVGDLVAERKQTKANCRIRGCEEPQFDDAIEWAEAESAGENFDPAVFQLGLSFAALGSTTDLLAQTLLLLANRPELIEPLRAEILEVLQADGWKKTALYRMKLLDSAIKEAQRIKPNSMISMRRLATKDIQLTDAIFIHRGERTVVDGYPMADPRIHQNPEVYDIFRFKNMRDQAGNENKAQLVSTSIDHTAFGHGVYACPGRFFAANEIKILLCHLLLKYDWKLAPGTSVKPVIAGAGQALDPTAKVLIRRRKEEIDLETLAYQ